MEKRVWVIGSLLVTSLFMIKMMDASPGLVTTDLALNLSTALHPLAFIMSSNGGSSSFNPPPFVSDSKSIDTRTLIRKGSEASASMFPYMTSLQVLWTDNRMYHICGAVLYATNKVLTAAHCMIYWGQFEHFVALGVQYISQGGEALIRVENATIHPNFDDSARDFPWDIAVLTMDSHAVLTSSVQLATLATFQDPSFEDLEECEIMGWGSTMDGTIPDGLHYSIMKGISNNVCRRFLRVFKYSGLQQYHKCAWNWPHASCQGDSGGPLVCQGLVVGISSWGVEGCTGCFPSVYSRVSYHNMWIMAQ